ncbi:CRH- protein [Tieghemiomyces parasiticus]|uniref:CRH- protein n=1 Tax=Tieghemiomyces parasiticus TaxID=78921 RepID=A0A9W7ZRI7_9FUNG|nr:CRH- protein [Tieghemiomyces parasiticus]
MRIATGITVLALLLGAVVAAPKRHKDKPTSTTSDAASPTGGNVNCQPITFGFDDASDLAKFVVDGGGLAEVQDGLLGMYMAEGHTATTLTYNHTIQYGRFSARLKTPKTSGIVTAFTLHGPSHDEVDLEWVGRDLTALDTTNFKKGKETSMTKLQRVPVPEGEAWEQFWDYGIELTPDAIRYIVNGKVERTIKNTDDKIFPSEADILKFGIWDGSGTDGWAGDKVVYGNNVYRAYIDWIVIEPMCADGTIPSAPRPPNTTALPDPVAPGPPPASATPGIPPPPAAESSSLVAAAATNPVPAAPATENPPPAASAAVALIPTGPALTSSALAPVAST